MKYKVKYLEEVSMTVFKEVFIDSDKPFTNLSEEEKKQAIINKENKEILHVITNSITPIPDTVSIQSIEKLY